MAELISYRSLIYWWGALSATVFVKDWLQQFVKFLRQPNLFIPQNLPFSVLPGLNSWIDGVATYIRDSVKFNPNQEIATIGSISIQNWAVAGLVGLLFLAVAITFYVRALRSPVWFDDFIALLVIYIVLRVIGHLVAIASLPIVGAARAFVDNPATAYFLILFLLLTMSFAGEGFRSKRAFWRALIEAGLVSVFMFPAEAVRVLSYVVEALALFGSSLSLPANTAFAVVWGVIGMLLALQRLVMQDAAGGAK